MIKHRLIIFTLIIKITFGIVLQPINQTVVDGNNIKIYCYNNKTVNWGIKSNNLNNNSNIYQLPNTNTFNNICDNRINIIYNNKISKLIIRNANINDTGLYLCIEYDNFISWKIANVYVTKQQLLYTN